MYVCLFSFFIIYQPSRLLNTKAILVEEEQWFYLIDIWKNKGFHAFPKNISPKVNMIVRREF